MVCLKLFLHRYNTELLPSVGQGLTYILTDTLSSYYSVAPAVPPWTVSGVTTGGTFHLVGDTANAGSPCRRFGNCCPLYLVSTEQFLKIDERMRRAYGQSEKIIQRLQSFSEGTQIHSRHYLHPHWLVRLEIPGGLLAGALAEDIFTPNNFGIIYLVTQTCYTLP